MYPGAREDYEAGTGVIEPSRICGVRKKVFWLWLLGGAMTIAAAIAIGIGAGYAVNGNGNGNQSGHDDASSHAIE